MLEFTNTSALARSPLIYGCLPSGVGDGVLTTIGRRWVWESCQSPHQHPGIEISTTGSTMFPTSPTAVYYLDLHRQYCSSSVHKESKGHGRVPDWEADRLLNHYAKHEIIVRAQCILVKLNVCADSLSHSAPTPKELQLWGNITFGQHLYTHFLTV